MQAMTAIRLSFAAMVVSILVPTQFALALVDAEQGPPAPEFTHHDTHEWINSEPLALSDFRGKVVLLDFWTFDCWNCYRSFPWLRTLETKHESAGLRVIGVHSPEFDHEKIRDNIVAKVMQFELRHPVMIDTDFSYWRAFDNRYWPAFYLLDKRGRVRAAYAGETHADDDQAQAIERDIKTLLAEPP